MFEDPQKFRRQKFQNFLKKMSEIALLGRGKRNKVMNFGEPSPCSVNAAN